jgi:hypothetical protein
VVTEANHEQLCRVGTRIMPSGIRTATVERALSICYARRTGAVHRYCITDASVMVVRSSATLGFGC